MILMIRMVDRTANLRLIRRRQELIVKICDSSCEFCKLILEKTVVEVVHHDFGQSRTRGRKRESGEVETESVGNFEKFGRSRIEIGRSLQPQFVVISQDGRRRFFVDLVVIICRSECCERTRSKTE